MVSEDILSTHAVLLCGQVCLLSTHLLKIPNFLKAQLSLFINTTEQKVEGEELHESDNFQMLLL